ncbi:MAG: hypothetical protein ABII82_03225, partial [Verrucomicrobiota bacterium]
MQILVIFLRFLTYGKTIEPLTQNFCYMLSHVSASGYAFSSIFFAFLAINPRTSRPERRPAACPP